MRKPGTLFGGRLFLRLIALIAALIITLSAAVLLGGRLISDLVRYQSSEFVLFASQMLKQNTERIVAESKELLDQMILSPQLGQLMNYQACDAADLLIGLRQLNSYCKSSRFIDSIYLYNAQNDQFYISSSHSTQAVQKREEMFDQSARDIIEHISRYDNMQPILRDALMIYPTVKTESYISFVRYNKLSKEKSNIYLLNIQKSVFLEYARDLSLGEQDGLALVDRQGNVIAALGSVAPEKIQRVLTAKSVKGTLKAAPNAIVGYDKTFPCDWILLYEMNLNEVDTLMSSQGESKVILLILTLALVLVLIALLVRRFIRVVWERNNEQRALQAERDAVHRLQYRHQVLEALKGRGNALLSQQTPCVAQMLLADCDKADEERLRRLLTDAWPQSILFWEIDGDGRCVCCLQENDVEENALEKLLAEGLIPRDSQESKPSFYVVSEEFEYPLNVKETYEFCRQGMQWKMICRADRILTPEKIRTRELKAETCRDLIERLGTAIQALDLDASIQLIDDIVRALSAGSLQSYRMGMLRLTLSVSESLTQIQKQYTVQGPEEKWLDAAFSSPEIACHSLKENVGQMLQDVLDKRSARYDELTEKVNQYIRQHCGEQQFSMDKMAENFNLSPAYIARIYKKQTGRTINERLMETRVEKAKEALLRTALPVSAIAENSGFIDSQYFYRVFKKHTGTTPGGYRQASNPSIQIKTREGETNNGPV